MIPAAVIHQDAMNEIVLLKDLISALEARIDELALERARQTHVIRRLVNRESHCEHADDGRHQCKHCDAYYPTEAETTKGERTLSGCERYEWRGGGWCGNCGFHETEHSQGNVLQKLEQPYTVNTNAPTMSRKKQ